MLPLACIPPKGNKCQCVETRKLFRLKRYTIVGPLGLIDELTQNIVIARIDISRVLHGAPKLRTRIVLEIEYCFYLCCE